MKSVRSFIANTRGNTALLFGIALLPIMAALGCQVDYVRGANVRTALQNAVDTAALAAARDAAGGTDAELTDRATKVFNVHFQRTDATLTALDVVRGTGTIRITARANVPTAVMSVFRIYTMPVSATGEVAFGRNKIELALVLDNTGSMAASGKMPALKAAVRDLLGVLQQAAYDKDAVKISIVPFNTQVNLGTTYKDADWLTFDADLDGMETTKTNWRGCVADRDKPNDVADGGSGKVALYPAARCAQAGLAPLMPLTNDFTALGKRVDDMTPEGNTNITIGTAWGLATLSPAEPLEQAKPFGADRLEKTMIVLTDGDNTQNRFTNNASQIDARTRLACRAVKDKSIKLYTIRVIDGNAKLLRECATSADTYFEVKNASELAPVFRRIASEISGIRLTH